MNRRWEVTTLSSDPFAQATLFEPPAPTAGSLSLADRFLIPPFSVLDGRSGPWQDRKNSWLGLGIRSELGRDDKLLDYSPLTEAHETKACGTCGGTGTDDRGQRPKKCRDCQGTGKRFANYGSVGNTSVFDPVLCELAYRWWSPEGGTVLDPFAGGSVRGLVAALLNRNYLGVDLRDEQVKENYRQASEILPSRPQPQGTPAWQVGDSRTSLPPSDTCDFVFTCPPYYDLEKYSTDPADLSNARTYSDFLGGYRLIIQAAVAALRPNRFAAIVVGEVRKKDGSYVGLLPDTIRAFVDAGAAFYSELVLLTPMGTAPVRTSRLFAAGRKATKCHQNVLVFVKGDWRTAVAACPMPEIVVEEGGQPLTMEELDGI